MNNKGAKYECFFCGELFHKADSLAANTSETLATMYCSSQCETMDREHNDRQIEMAKIYDNIYTEKELARQRLEKAVEDEKTQIIQMAGGYRIKVKKENT